MYILKHKDNNTFLVLNYNNGLEIVDSNTVRKFDGLLSHRDYGTMRMLVERSNLSYGSRLIDDSFNGSYMYNSVHPIDQYEVVKV